MELTVEDFKEIRNNGDEDLLNLLLDEETLTNEQLDTVFNCICSEKGKMIIADEMGLGKTYSSLGIIKIISMIRPNKKIIVSAPKNTVPNFAKLIKKSTGLTVETFTARKEDIERMKRNFFDTDVFVVQHSFWIYSMSSLFLIYNNMDKFSLSIFDEADYKRSSGFGSFLEFSRRIDFSFILNATPIEKDIDLTYNLLYGCKAVNTKLNSFKYKYMKPIYKNGAYDSSYIDVPALLKDFSDTITVKNRSSLGIQSEIEVIFHRIKPTTIQRNWIEEGMPSNLALYSPLTYKRGVENIITPISMSSESVKALEIVSSLIKEGIKSVIYVFNTQAIVTIMGLIEELGYNPYVIDGKHTKTEKEIEVMEKAFNEDPKGMMVTNKIKGSNLGSANRVIIYNNPSDLQQLIYRVIRGYDSKSVKVDWIYYPEFEAKHLKSALIKTKNVSEFLDRELNLIELEEEVNKNKNIIASGNKSLNRMLRHMGRR